jgi:DNA-binding MarR family transcriptional regulator
MDIGAVKHVRRFATEHQKATYNIIYTSGWLVGHLEKRAQKAQITLQQFNVLRILRGRAPEPATNNLIKERMIDRMSDVSRIIDRLVTKGLAERRTNHIDRRSVSIHITEKGLETLALLEDSMLLNDLLLEQLGEEDCKQLNRLLDKMRGKEERI